MDKNWLRSLFRRRVAVAVMIVLQVLFFLYILTSTSKLSVAISVFFTTLSILAVLYIVSRGDKGSYKLIWVLLILSFPLFGGILYLMVKAQSSTLKFKKSIEKVHKKAETLYASNENRLNELCGEFPQYTVNATYLSKCAGFPVYNNTYTKYLSPGEEKFKHLLEELEKAEKYIFLEYFIIQEGKMWDSILEVLKKKASQGVKVRIIYDDMGCFLLLPSNYRKQLESYGIECIVFNKFRPLLTVLQNNRDHRKIVSIDGKVAFTGGINLADEYINAYEKHGHWKDASVMIKGDAAWSLTLIFLQMWELCTNTDEDYNKYYPEFPQKNFLQTKGFIQPYCDSPLDEEYVGEQVYTQIINSAKKYLYICTPYLIPDESMVSALCLAAKSGVDVRIITPHKWDKHFVHLTTRSFYRELISAGVKIYEYTNGFMHSKTFLSDDSIATVGTINLDYRSLYLHFECGVLMFGTDAVSQLKEDFDNTLKISQEITKEDCKGTLLSNLIQDILRIFAPLM